MRRQSLAVALIVFCSALSSQIAAAENPHRSQHTAHGAIPTESGQGAFAAIAEIVALLENDPMTDWSRVDINLLREHLQDMNALTLGASVVQTHDENQVRFAVTGKGAALRAIHAMVPAHGRELNGSTDWTVTVESNPSGAVMRVAAPAGQLERLRALGFFGVMATGAHHQAHHLRIARGDRQVHH